MHLIIVKKGFAMAASKRYSEQWNIWAYYINPWGCMERNILLVHLPVHPSQQCEFITFPEFTAVWTDWWEGVNFPGLHEWTTMLIMVGPWMKLSANADRYRPIRTGIGVYHTDLTNAMRYRFRLFKENIAIYWQIHRLIWMYKQQLKWLNHQEVAPWWE